MAKTVHEIRFPRYNADINLEKRTLFHVPIGEHFYEVGDGLRLLAAPNFPRCKVGQLVDVRQVKLLTELDADLGKLGTVDRAAYLASWDAIYPKHASADDPVVWRIEFRYGRRRLESPGPGTPRRPERRPGRADLRPRPPQPLSRRRDLGLFRVLGQALGRLSRPRSRRECTARWTIVTRCMTMQRVSQERRDYQLSIRVPRRIWDAIEEQAERERRTASDVVNNHFAKLYPAPGARGKASRR